MISICVYIIFAAIIVLGGKFAGFKKDQFHEDYLSIDVTKCICGAAAIGVILHHISLVTSFQSNGIMSLFGDQGPKLVGIFFFCSGYGLIKSMKKKENYFKGFIKNRLILTITIPFYINVIIYGICYAIAGIEKPAIQWITNFFGLTMMNEYAWFPIVISVMYISFYVVFKKARNIDVAIIIMAIIVILQIVLWSVNGHFAWWAGEDNWWMDEGALDRAEWWKQMNVMLYSGQWWTNSLVGMIIGFIYAQHEATLSKFFKKIYWLKLIVLIALWRIAHLVYTITVSKGGYYTEFNGNGPGIKDKLVTTGIQSADVICFLFVVAVVLMKIKPGNFVLRFMGKFSLHTYLMNLIIIQMFTYMVEGFDGSGMGVKDSKYVLFIVIILVGSVVAGVIESYICEGVKKKIRNLQTKRCL